MACFLKSRARMTALALLGGISLVAVWSLRELVKNRPPPLSLSGLTVHRNLAYASGERHGLDIYAPRGAYRSPVVIYSYGGAWTSGSKEDGGRIAANLARHGFVAVVPDYRLYPTAVWPLFLQDNAAAVRWVKDNIPHYGGDPDRLILMGHSAGAFNVVNLAADNRWLAQVGLSARRDLKAVVGLSGVYNMLPLHGDTEKAIFGSRTGYGELLDRINGNTPPMLLIVGRNDRVAGTDDTVRTAGRIRARGGFVRTIIYSGLDHDDTREALAAGFSSRTHLVSEDVFRFLSEVAVAPQEGANEVIPQAR